MNHQMNGKRRRVQVYQFFNSQDLQQGGGGRGGFSDKDDEEEARLKELVRVDFLDDLTSGGYVLAQLRMVVIISELRKFGSLLT